MDFQVIYPIFDVNIIADYVATTSVVGFLNFLQLMLTMKLFYLTGSKVIAQPHFLRKLFLRYN